MTRWMFVVSIMAAVVAAAPRAAAGQTTLDVYVQRTGGDQLFRVDPDGPRVLSVRPLTAEESKWAGGAATSDGRFLLAATGETQTGFPGPSILWFLTIRDLAAQETARIPWPGFPFLEVHPRRTEIVTSTGVALVALGTAGQRRVAGCDFATLVGLSGDGSRLLYQCGGPASPYLVGDADSGAVVADLGANFAPRPVLNISGRDVYDVDAGRVRRRSVDSGVVLALTEIPHYTSPAGLNAFVNHITGDVFVVGDRINVFDGTTLALKGSRVAPWDGLTGANGRANWIFDPERPRLYVLAQSADTMRFLTLSTETLQTLSDTAIPGGTANSAIRLVPRPPAPAALLAAVQGQSVTLSWAAGAPAPQTLRYVLEVGSAPGLSDIFTGLDVGLQTSFAASGVPPGNYYVRVRAGNYTGLSAPSNEVVVQVP